MKAKIVERSLKSKNPKAARIAQDQTTFWLFVLPVLATFIVFYVVPFFSNLHYSFFKWNGISTDMQYVGLQNYISILSGNANYAKTVSFSFSYVLGLTVLLNVIALLLALALSKPMRTSSLFRVLFFLPHVISAVIAGFVWQFIFTKGVAGLYDLTGLGIFSKQWLSDVHLAKLAIIIAQTWIDTGYVMVIYIAGLISISPAIEEAATIDGATGFKRLIYVTLPNMMPSITVNLFMTLSSAFKSFDLNMALTGGGPARSTLGMALDIYFDGFSNNLAGYASAKAVILFAIVAVVSLLQMYFTKRKEV